jgi:hypothetical protein
MNKAYNMYLLDAVKKLDLKNFMEREAGVSFEKAGQSWKCPCPLHRESQPSFALKMEPNGVWIYHCFGCEAKGTIIDFCMEFFNETNPWKAALLAAEKDGLKLDESVVIKAMQNSTVQDNRLKDVMISHFVTSFVCLKLLRVCNGDEKTMSWVARAYASMNKILDDETARRESFETIGAEATRRAMAFTKG